MNLLVAASMDTAAARLPRQSSGGGRLDDEANAGVSAFAFQGTNAHAVIGELHGWASDAVLREVQQYQTSSTTSVLT